MLSKLLLIILSALSITLQQPFVMSDDSDEIITLVGDTSTQGNSGVNRAPALVPFSCCYSHSTHQLIVRNHACNGIVTISILDENMGDLLLEQTFPASIQTMSIPVVLDDSSTYIITIKIHNGASFWGII